MEMTYVNNVILHVVLVQKTLVNVILVPIPIVMIAIQHVLVKTDGSTIQLLIVDNVKSNVLNVKPMLLVVSNVQIW